MGLASHLSRRFCVVCCACVTIFAGLTGAGEPVSESAGRVSIGHASDGDWTLIPTAHPTVPRELSRLWLAPVAEDHVAGSSVLARLASGVALYQQGKYADALTRMSPRTSLDKPAADYAAYYSAQAQLKLGHVESARRQFAVLTASQPVGYLSEAAALGEAEAAEAAGDHAAAQRIYERLLLRSRMAPDRVWFRLGKASLAAGNRARAIEAFRHVHHEFPLSAFTSEVTSALSILKALEPLAPANARYGTELIRADVLFAAKRYTEARSAFDRLRAYATGVERGRLEVRRAACEYFTGRYAAARATLGPHRERGAHQAEARFYDLMAARGLGAHAEFVRLARDFVRSFGETIWAEEVLDALGTHFIQQNQDDDADAAFRQLLDTFPTGRFAERASWKVGWRAYRFGSAAEAAQVFERAASAFPRSDYRPAYVYWAARARGSLGEYEVAASRYALVRTDYLHSYYGRLADAALERRDVPLRAALVTNVASPTKPAADAAMASLPPTADLIRLLLSAGLYDDALNEIRYAQHIWGDAPVLRATVGWLHHQKGELLTGANVVKRSYPQYIAADGDTLPSELLAVIFPMGYWSLIQQHAARHQLDPYLLAALIAQESAFIPDIRSPAKAAGLMQLMPATAQRYARKLALPYSPAMVRRPETNIRLGTAYFADLVREFGNVHLALASYNAGESRVRRWVAERPDLPPDEFVDDIPFPETQNYVKKILGAAENYRRVYGADSDVPSNPNRAIPSLASRRSGLVQTPPRPSAPRAAPAPIRAKAKPASAPAKAKPGTTGSKAKTAKPKSTESPLARTSTRRPAQR